MINQTAAFGGGGAANISGYAAIASNNEYHFYYTANGSEKIFATQDNKNGTSFTAHTTVFNTGGTAGYVENTTAGNARGRFISNSSNLASLSFDSLGNLYFGDYANYLVRQIKVTNALTTGLAPVTSASSVTWIAGNPGSFVYNGDTTSYNTAA